MKGIDMPGILPNYDINDKNVNELFDKEFQTRNATISQYWEWRGGEHPAVLKVEPGQRDDNITLNLCGQLVEDVADFVGMPSFAVKGGTDNVAVGNELEVTKTPEEEVLEVILQEMAFAEIVADTIESGLVSGHCFLRVVLDEGGIPELALIDPRFIAVAWDMTRIGMKKSILFYRMKWQPGDVTRLQDIVPDWLMPEAQRINADVWHIIEYQSKKQATTFEEIGREVWAYPFPPIGDFKVARKPHDYYGQSLLSGAAKLNDAINFVATNTGRIIKHHAHPKTFLFGASISDMDVIGGVYDNIPESARIENLEMQGDLDSSMRFLEMLRGSFFSQKRVVDPHSIKDKVGNLTNFGVRVLYAGMLHLIENKRGFFADGIGEMLRRAMWVSGYENVEIIANWTDPLPTNRVEAVAATAQEAALGITSKQTLADELGRDFMRERQQIAEEKATTIDEAVAMIERTAANGLF